MTDTTITKIDSSHSPKGSAGQKYLACGKSMSMRLWENEPVKKDKEETKHDYETLGYVLKGKAELHLEGQMVVLSPGDSWVVPKGASHKYVILEDFSAVETTSPPAELHDRACGDNANSAKEFFAESAKDAAALTEVKPVKPDNADMKAKAATESKADADAKPEAGAKVEADAKPEAESKATAEPNGKSKAEAQDKAEGKPKAGEKSKADDQEKGNDQVCDPNTKECKPGSDDGKQGKEAKEETPAKEKSAKAENQAEQVQAIAGQIPRTESTPTSNSGEKEQKPAEHVDVAKGNSK